MTRTRTALAMAAATLAITAPIVAAGVPHDAAVRPSAPAVDTAAPACAASASDLQRFMCFRHAALSATEAHNIPHRGGSGTR